MSSFTEAWEEAVATANPHLVEFVTLELNHSAFVDESEERVSIRAVASAEDHDFVIENTAVYDAGETVTFTAIPFEFMWPDMSDDSVPAVEVKIDNIGREILPYVIAATKLNEPVSMIIRVYTVDTRDDSSVLSNGPPPPVLYLRDVSITDLEVRAKASPGDLYNRRAMRIVYDLTNYPTLTYNT